MDDGEKIARVLGEPILEEFSAHALAIRRNLMLVSFIAIIIATYDLAVTGQFVGINIEGLTNVVVREIFFLLVLYHLIHFVWATWDHLQYWRIRITGTRLAHQTAGKVASDLGDYPPDPRQSSLYRWWFEAAAKIGNIQKTVTELQRRADAWEGKIEGALADDAKLNLRNVLESLGQVRNSIPDLSRKIETATKALDSKRIPESLSRFDRWYFRFQKSQLARWILVEWLFPVVMGTWALYLTFPPQLTAMLSNNG